MGHALFQKVQQAAAEKSILPTLCQLWIRCRDPSSALTGGGGGVFFFTMAPHPDGTFLPTNACRKKKSPDSQTHVQLCH